MFDTNFSYHDLYRKLNDVFGEQEQEKIEEEEKQDELTLDEQQLVIASLFSFGKVRKNQLN